MDSSFSRQRESFLQPLLGLFTTTTDEAGCQGSVNIYWAVIICQPSTEPFMHDNSLFHWWEKQSSKKFHHLDAKG